MVVVRTVEVHQRIVTPAQVLLRRRGAVYLPGVGSRTDTGVAGVELLEADLIDRGWMLAPELRDALVRLDTADLVGAGAQLLADCDALVGADRSHVPLFRRFPDSTPADTLAFFVDRVLTVWFQAPEQPCVLCAAEGTVAPVNPCGHLVCRACSRPGTVWPLDRSPPAYQKSLRKKSGRRCRIGAEVFVAVMRTTTNPARRNPRS
jgi:hypothetical protein